MAPKSGACKAVLKQESASSADAQPLDCSTNKPSPAPSSSNPSGVLRAASRDRSQTPDDTRLEVRLCPNLKIRRLWGPHQGRLRIPNPPKLISNWLVEFLISRI